MSFKNLYLEWVTPILSALIVLALGLFSSGCGGGGDTVDSGATGGSSSSVQTVSFSGVIVDPFIVGAVLCEDLDISETCDAGEQVSSASSAEGVFTFDSALTPGSHVMIQTQGKHEGVTYDLDISGVVDANGSADVVSPLTTLEAKGLTSAQIAEILNAAATKSNIMLSDGVTPWAISASNILTNPLANNLLDTKVGSLNESDLVTIQASLASYAMLKIMEGSTTLKALKSTDLYYSGMGLYGHDEVQRIVMTVMQNLTATLNKAMLTTIKTGIDTGRTALATGLLSHPSYPTAVLADAKASSSMPEPTVELVIKVAVSILDKLASTGFQTCNATVGTNAEKVTAALTAVDNKSAIITAMSTSLGNQLYGLTYQTELSQLEDVGFAVNLVSALPADVQTGITAGKNGKVTIRFDDTNALVAL